MNLDSIKGALKSKTMWLGLLTMVLPYSDQLVGIVSGIAPITGTVLGAAVMILRVLTTTSLADK